MSVACAFDASGDASSQVGSETGTSIASPSSEGADELDPSASTAASATATGGSTTTTSSSSSEGSSEASGSADDGSSTGTTGELPRAPWCDPEQGELVACYTFEGLADGVLVDASSVGNHGSVVAVGIEVGPSGEAAVFSSDSVISVPAHPSTDFGLAATMELFLRIDAVPTSGRSGVIDREGQWSIFLHAAGGLRCGSSNGSTYWDTPRVGEWLHVGCVIDGGDVRLYIDGELVSEFEEASPLETGNQNPLAIGDNSPGFDEPLAGAISGLRLWTLARTADELCEGAGELCR
ncbi:MAG: LamG domain-containing protein [Deltaproteobacteria bacterium]|nr:LamG domain-containing protein [Nannocystaceae bacterium]